MDDSKYPDEVILRLNAIILLLLDLSANSGEVTTTSKILRLTEYGFAPSEVARIIGKETKYVTSILSQHKKKKVSGKKS